ncbi:hypothetical protein GCM10023172_02630 [Hymenobacter ginsengisoli]|uniref:Uncharacterized protein n=1 Tax=Hymenobacter ginsengisoli TaxID=1051626 RepID=A0ABP8PZ08_9BACT|nr:MULTISPECIES: hypothetical protein [unclassified Hymenobacter]MBO2030366.1 hypothetical protein [Hymenobacter sp. BT559]
MAELRIQPKKSSPSPWLLVALALLALAAAAYFFLRPDPADERAPAPAATTVAPDSLAAPGSAPASPSSADSASSAAPVASPPPGTNGTGASAQLLQLREPLTQLGDRADLRDDAQVREQRDNFTSATDRLASGDPQASLRPGFVAAANLLLAVQQKAYPQLETDANNLSLQASQLSGRDATPAEQAQNRAYLSKAADLLKAVSEPATPQP